jgi:hypothetical protein
MKALLNAVLDFNFSQKARNFWTEFDFITFSRRTLSMESLTYPLEG